MAVQAEPSTATRIIRRAPSPATIVEADIAVIGAGIAGIAAALTAARLGRKVVIADSLPVLGGQAVNSVIGLFAGLFSNGHDGYQLTRGFVDGMLRDLDAQGALHWRRGPPHKVVLYDEVALARWIEEAVRKAGITVLLGAVMREVEVEGQGRLTKVRFAHRCGDVELRAKGFVDASGDAALCWQAGFACREFGDGPIYGSQMVVLEHVNEAALPTREAIAARQAEKAESYGMTRHDGFAFPFLGRGLALVNMTHIETPMEPLAFSAMPLEGRHQADKAIRFLKGEYPEAFGAARVRTYGFPGIRQTRWIVGRQQVTADQVRSGEKFPDAIARTAWPIELHSHAEGYIWQPFPPEHMHYVPFGALVPAEAENVVAAGRCIDGDAAALSSVRVMGPGMAMGMAAAHALDLAGAGSVQQIDVGALVDRVRENVEGEGPRY